MSVPSTLQTRQPLLSPRLALGAMLLLWLAYTILFTLNRDDAPAAWLEFIPGLLGVAVLAAAGSSLPGCFLRLAPLSWAGLGRLALSALLMPLVWFSGRWIGWSGGAALVYALASGVSQELFFRAALLPAFLANCQARPLLAVLLQALFFALWHIPKALATAPLGGVIGVALVTFLCGVLWALQVRRDQTVVWLMGYHTLLLVINSFFTWG